MSRLGDALGVTLIVLMVISAAYGVWSLSNDHTFFALRITHEGIGIPNISVEACYPTCDPHAITFKQIATNDHGVARADVGWFKGDPNQWIFVFTYGGTTYQYPAVVNALVEDPI